MKILTTKWSVGRWADDECTNKYAYICEKHRSKNVDDVCKDSPRPGWSSMCKDIIKKPEDCRKLRKRQKEACMRTCQLCDRFFKPSVDPSITKKNPCKKGWRPWNKECWTLTQLNYTWDEAASYCASEGGEIATIPDEFTQAWAYSQLADPTENPELALPVGQIGWIGMRKYHGELNYKWKSGWPVTYTNWGAGQARVPRNVTTRGCVAAVGQAVKAKNYQGGFWYDYNCTTKLRALCRITDKKPPKNVTVYPGNCPGTDWIPFKNYCYLVRKDQLSTWYQAEYDCLRYNAHSTSVHSVEEAKFLMRKTANARASSFIRRAVWIGLYHSRDDDTYSWTDKSPVDFMNWAEGEPTKRGGLFKELCTELSATDGKWRDTTCNRIGITVCKIAKALPTVNKPTASTSPFISVKTSGNKTLIAIIIVLILLLGGVIVGLFYCQRNRSSKDSYRLQLPNVSFREFFSHAPGFRSFVSASSGDQQGLVEEADYEDITTMDSEGRLKD